jgi:hypothetical protein
MLTKIKYQSEKLDQLQNKLEKLTENQEIENYIFNGVYYPPKYDDKHLVCFFLLFYY